MLYGIKLFYVYVAVTVGNGTGARVPTVITFLFWQISMICFFQHIQSMTKLYHSKSHWIWLKNKKVMAKFVPSATGQLADMRKSTQFSNCSYVLSLREKCIFLSRECYQYCWESILVTLVCMVSLDFFIENFLQKYVMSATGRRQRDVPFIFFFLHF